MAYLASIKRPIWVLFGQTVAVPWAVYKTAEGQNGSADVEPKRAFTTNQA
jgi:hypothetical protein